MDGESLSHFFEQYEFDETNLTGGVASPEDIFRVLEGLEDVSEFSLVDKTELNSKDVKEMVGCMMSHRLSVASSGLLDSENEVRESTLAPKCKRQKLSVAAVAVAGGAVSSDQDQYVNPDGNQKMAHITVERNRRKQMNEHLTILRSLMPCFYVKRGDQASVIGGVVNYISELQQVLQSLESKKQRKVFSEVLSPRIISPNPKSSPLSPRKPPLSPRLNLPISPRTPPSNTTSPYKPRLLLLPAPAPSPPPLPPTISSVDSINELVANSKSAIAEVEVKFSGENVLVQTVSPHLPGQAVKIIAAIDNLSLEILQVNISTLEETMITSFTIKIGIECELSADELAHLVQQTFC